MSRRRCPHCDSPLASKALACPECGSDAETGWADDDQLHEAAFGEFDEEDYRDVIADLPGANPDDDTVRRRWILAVIALVALTAFVLVYVL